MQYRFAVTFETLSITPDIFRPSSELCERSVRGLEVPPSPKIHPSLVKQEQKILLIKEKNILKVVNLLLLYSCSIPRGKLLEMKRKRFKRGKGKRGKFHQ